MHVEALLHQKPNHMLHRFFAGVWIHHDDHGEQRSLANPGGDPKNPEQRRNSPRNPTDPLPPMQ
jgi:hypothetical protein